MKLGPRLLITLLGCLFIYPTAASEDAILTDSFSIGPTPASISDLAISNFRKAAIKNADRMFRQSDDPTVGNPDGNVTMVAFLDYLCPISEQLDPIFQNLISTNPNLRVVYKELPLRGDVSIYAAKAALAANKQGKYLPLHKALMAAGKNLTKAKILALAQAAGLDMAQLKSDMNNEKTTQKIDEVHYFAKEINLMGTPSLFFAKTDVSTSADNHAVHFMMGKFTQEDLQQAVNYIAKK